MKRLGSATFYRDALAIALPVMLQQLIMSMVSLVDNFMVAGLGDVKMAAVNVANQINFVSTIALMTLNAAGGIYLAQYRGARDEEGMKQAFRFKALFSLSLATLHFILLWTIPERLIGIMTVGNDQRDAIITVGASYLRLTSFTWFPMALSTAIATAFREIGKARIPLLISVSAGIVNTLGNWILIYGNWGAPRLEVTGAAIATVAARVLELACFLSYVKLKPEAFFVPFSGLLAVDRRLIASIFRKSGMMLASELTWVFSETIMTALYNGRGGAETVAGMGAGWAIGNMFFLAFSGVHTATAVIVGSTLGAGNLSEARNQARWLKAGSLFLGLAVAACAAASVLLIPLVFANLTLSARAVTRGLVLSVAAFMPLWTLLNFQFALSRAGGDAALGMYVDVSVSLLLFVPGAFVLALCTPLGPVAMFAILKSTDFVKYLIANWYLKKERWVKNLTAPL